MRDNLLPIQRAPSACPEVKTMMEILIDGLVVAFTLVAVVKAHRE